MRKKYLEQLYALARLHKLVNTKGEFATFIGIDGSTLSHAFTVDGRVNLENIITRAEHALLKAGVSLDEIPSGTTSVRERLEELLKSYKINISQFEKEIGVANGTIRRIGDNISANLQEKISTRFPTLNMDWLVYGVGNIIDYGTNTGQIRDDKQTAHDNNAPVFQNTGRGGNNVTQGAPASTIDSLIAEMRAQREASEKQIDRLLTIIENMQK